MHQQGTRLPLLGNDRGGGAIITIVSDAVLTILEGVVVLGTLKQGVLASVLPGLYWDELGYVVRAVSAGLVDPVFIITDCRLKPAVVVRRGHAVFVVVVGLIVNQKVEVPIVIVYKLIAGRPRIGGFPNPGGFKVVQHVRSAMATREAAS